MEDTFKQRLVEEKQALDEKLLKLSTFIGSPKFNEVDPTQQDLLKIQETAMATYSRVLTTRLKLLF